MSEKEEVVGATVELEQTEPGVYKARQVDRSSDLPPVGDNREIDWSFGPIKVNGYVDLDTYDIGATVAIMGISLGNMSGSLKDSLSVDIDLFHAAGVVRFYLKNGNELWVHQDIKIKFDGSFEGDYKIFSF